MQGCGVCVATPLLFVGKPTFFVACNKKHSGYNPSHYGH